MSRGTPVMNPSDFAEFIEDNRDLILQTWLKELENLEAARSKKKSFLKNELPEFLQYLSEVLKNPMDIEAILDARNNSASHGQQRATTREYEIPDVVHEYSLLRETIYNLVNERNSLNAECYVLMGRIFDIAVAIAVKEFVLERDISADQEKWLRSVLDKIPTAFMLIDPASNRLTFGNHRAQEMLGIRFDQVSLDERFGQGRVLVFKDGRPLEKNELPSVRAIRGEKLTNEEFQIQSPNGFFDIAVTSEFLPASYGHPETLALMILDVTNTKQAQKALIESEKRFRSTFAHAAVGIAITDTENRVIEVNPAYTDITGYANEELVGTNLSEIVHPEDRHFETNEIAKVISGEIPAHILEKRYIRKDGRIVWVQNSISSVKNTEGKIDRIIRISADITEQRELSQELQYNEQILAMATEVSGVGVWDLNFASGRLRFSRIAQQIFALDQSDIFLSDILPLFHPDDRREVEEKILASAKVDGPDFFDIEVRHFMPDGDIRWTRSLGKTVFGGFGPQRRPIRLTGTVVDITEQVRHREELHKAVRAAQSASEAKSQFLANMSHEIRTPLGAIMGFVNLLKDERLSSREQEEFISVISRNSEQLLRIINDILDLSKVEAGMMTIEEIDFSLVNLLSDFSALMGFKAREKGIGFFINATTDIPDIIRSDPTRVRQILGNIVGNAIKFTEQGHVQMNVSFHEPFLEFEVIDTGQGINKEQEKNLFQAFTQADATVTRKYGGTGLGLVLTRRLSEAMGGEFFLKESTPGKGSIFLSRIRVYRPAESQMVKGLGFKTEPFKNPPMQEKLTGMRVLLVEDSPDIQSLISFYLIRSGAQVEIASDGIEGCEMALNSSYHAILMDVQMPVMDGITAVRKLRSKGYDKPVIALTAHAMKEEIDRCMEAGFSDFRSKPVNKEDLIEMLHQIYISQRV
ncbi:PAS domain S-box protein [Bdellovibrio sp. 22V]|uniref:PAS domain S-box protein n=1 Tax=Bdellovibrio TaxID=958 RepID=UPI002542AEAF|nr:PAS domain S-box protein [Bdellovibrio sp. 22V]WII72409.1 PAS domain S-box protein [Bdellovibrio sp. 22V]